MHEPLPNATVLLSELAAGRAEAAERLFPLVYEELRAIAGGHLAKERAGHTLQPTALVNEVYVRLVGAGPWESKLHFYRVASLAMRRVLVNHARDRKRLKRGGGAGGGAGGTGPRREPLDSDTLADPKAGPFADDPTELLALDEALEALAALDDRKVQIVQLRYFGGFTIDETAAILEISPAQTKRDWASARAFLRLRIAGAGPG